MSHSTYNVIYNCSIYSVDINKNINSYRARICFSNLIK